MKGNVVMNTSALCYICALNSLKSHPYLSALFLECILIVQKRVIQRKLNCNDCGMEN